MTQNIVARTCDRRNLSTHGGLATKREEVAGIAVSPSRSSVTRLPLTGPHFYSEYFDIKCVWGGGFHANDPLDTSNCDGVHLDSVLTAAT